MSNNRNAHKAIRTTVLLFTFFSHLPARSTEICPSSYVDGASYASSLPNFSSSSYNYSPATIPLSSASPNTTPALVQTATVIPSVVNTTAMSPMQTPATTLSPVLPSLPSVSPVQNIAAMSNISNLASLESRVNNFPKIATASMINIQHQTNLTLFSSANQVLHGARGQVIFGDQGTILSQDKNIIILHKGRLTLNSGAEGTVVRTSKGEVCLNPMSVALIEDKQGKSLHVTALAGKSEAIQLRGAATNNKLVTAEPGQELIVSESGIQDEEMIPCQGPCEVVCGSIEKRPTVVRTKVASRLPVVAESISSRAGKFARLSGSTSMSSSRATSVEGKNSQKQWEMMKDAGNPAPLQVLAQAGSTFSQKDDGALSFTSGSLFVFAKNNLQIDTEYGKAEAKRNGIIMVENFGSVCKIKALSGPGDIRFVSGSTTIDLAPGQELIIAKRALSNIELNPADAIARRSCGLLRQTNGLYFCLNEFSLSSMIHYAGYRQIFSSSDNTGKLIDKILKTAVVVEMVTRSRGQYRYSTLYTEQKDTLETQTQISSAKIN